MLDLVLVVALHADHRPCISRDEFRAIHQPVTRARLERKTETTGLAVLDPHAATLADGSTVDNWFYPDCRFGGRRLIQITYVDGIWDVIVYPSRQAVLAGIALEA